jgi:hypothetical protein
MVDESRRAAETWQPTATLADARSAADRFLRESVGDSLFVERFVFDPLNTDSSAEQMKAFGITSRVIAYWFTLPNDPDAATLTTVLIDEEGKVAGGMGVPDCGDDGAACDLIDHETAIAAVHAAGIPEGIEPPRWKLRWLPYPGFCYTVTVVLREHADHYECEEAVVDAGTGEVLAHRRHAYGRTEPGESAGTGE